MKNLIVAIAMITGITFYGNPTDLKMTDEFSAKTPAVSWLAKKEPIKMANLPKDARQYLKENFPSKGLIYVTKNKNASGDVVYEVGITMEGKLSILQFDKKGELVSEKMTSK